MPTRATRIAATGLAGATVWLAAAELPWPARLLVTFLLVVLPVVVLAQLGIAAEVPKVARRVPLYLSSAAAIWTLAALTLAAALGSGLTAGLLGLRALPAPTLASWTSAVTLVGLALLALARALNVRETALLAYLLPRTAGEKAAFAGLALTAGIGEELVFRSFLIPALGAATGSVWLAAVLSAGVFGLLHAYQGGSGAVRAGLLGFVLAVPFVLTGSVLPSMIAHAALDLLAGLWLADWLLRR